jgi:group II intron reverse transcriptase/maturase
MMHEHGKSYSSIVPEKPPNNASRNGAAEAGEGRELAEGNLRQSDTLRTQSRKGVHSGLERVRYAAQKNKTEQFTALFHHVYEVARLRAAYYAVKRDAVAGIDGETWKHYGKDLEDNLQGLSGKLKRGAYRANPARRGYIRKADGRQRPIGVLVLEDKIVQRAEAEVLSTIYETEFLGFSYGYRPKRDPHKALDALAVGIQTKKVNWVLDADIRGFFDTLNHDWLIKFVEHRVGDRRVIRLIRKWLTAGVLEDGERRKSEIGTIQGGSISPLLANIYLHYVFDLWIQRWRTKQAHGDIIVVRYADDFVVGFQHRDEAERLLTDLRKRLSEFGLELHPEKTRMIEFGRYAEENRAKRGAGKPDTFNFLGFTHICGKTRKGKYTVLRHTMRKRWQAKLKELKEVLRKRMHFSIPVQGQYLKAVLRGHFQYYGVPQNSRSLGMFRMAVGRLWWKILCRRSNKSYVRWDRMNRYIARWFPLARVCHPYPSVQYGVTT